MKKSIFFDFFFYFIVSWHLSALNMDIFVDTMDIKVQKSNENISIFIINGTSMTETRSGLISAIPKGNYRCYNDQKNPISFPEFNFSIGPLFLELNKSGHAVLDYLGGGPFHSDVIEPQRYPVLLSFSCLNPKTEVTYFGSLFYEVFEKYGKPEYTPRYKFGWIKSPKTKLLRSRHPKADEVSLLKKGEKIITTIEEGIWTMVHTDEEKTGYLNRNQISNVFIDMDYFVAVPEIKIHLKPNSSSKVNVLAKKDEKVNIITYTTNTEIISGRPGFWAEVITTKGKKGYAFTGFLREGD